MIRAARLCALGGLALLGLAGAGLAQPATTSAADRAALDAPVGPNVSLNEIYNAFRAICVAHQGDREAQADAGLAAPYNLEPQGISRDGVEKYGNGRMSLRIWEDESLTICMVMANVAGSTTLAQGVATAQPHLRQPTRQASSADGRKSALWRTPSGKQIVYLQMTRGGRTIGGFMLGEE